MRSGPDFQIALLLKHAQEVRRLELRKAAAPRWTITENRDQTDCVGGNELPIALAETNRAADGDFALRVTFLETQFVNTLAGDYEMTLTGTITPR